MKRDQDEKKEQNCKVQICNNGSFGGHNVLFELINSVRFSVNIFTYRKCF